MPKGKFLILKRFLAGLLVVFLIPDSASFSFLETTERTPSSSFILPPILGKVEEIYIPSTLRRNPKENLEIQGWETAPFVIHIQDAHSSLEAQKKIKEILAFLADRTSNQPLLVALEGSTGELRPEYLDVLPDRSPREDKAVLELFKAGVLSGGELFAWEQYQKCQRGKGERAADKKQIRILGVETAELYRENLKVYRDFHQTSSEFQRSLQEFRTQLTSAQSRFLNSRLLKFIQEVEKRREGQFPSGKISPNLYAYLSFLSTSSFSHLGIDLRDRFEQIRFPHLTRLLFLIEFEKKIPRRQKSILQSEIGSKDLFKEILFLESQILEKLVSSPVERDLVEISEGFKLFEKLLRFELSAEEYQKISSDFEGIHPTKLSRRLSLIFRKILPSYEELVPFYEKAIKFYELAKHRDFQLLENALREAKHFQPSGRTPAIVLVAGGFHTEGLLQGMRRRNIPYLVIAPHITGTPSNATRYHELLSGTWLSSGSFFESFHLAWPLVLTASDRHPFPEEQQRVLSLLQKKVAFPSHFSASQVWSRAEVRTTGNPLVEGIHLRSSNGGEELLRGVGERTPDWQRMKAVGALIFDTLQERPSPVTLEEILETAVRKLKAQGLDMEGEEATKKKVKEILDRLVQDGFLRRGDQGYELAESKEIFSIQLAHVENIRRSLREALHLLTANKSGADIQLERIITDYARALQRWPFFPVEARWPILKAVALLERDEQEKLVTFLEGKDTLRSFSLVDSILLMLQSTPPPDWVKRNVPRLMGRTIYYIASEVWNAAGGLGRVGQYHTRMAQELLRTKGQIVTIEPLYPFQLTQKGELFSVDYTRLLVPVKNMEVFSEYEVTVRGKKVQAEVFKGTNSFGIEIYLIKDRGDYYTKLMYRYGPTYGTAEWHEFSEFFSRASLELIRILEAEKQKKEGYQSPIIWVNDGQPAPVSVFKRILDMETNDSTLRNALVWFTTHTYINRSGSDVSWGPVYGMGLSEKWANYFKRLGGHYDFTSGAVRTSDGVNGVGAVQVQEVAHIDPWVAWVAITNGDDRIASSEVFRSIFKETSFQKLFPDADPEYPSPEQIIEVKKIAKDRLKSDSRLLSLNPEFGNLDPEGIVISYSGRLVPEKLSGVIFSDSGKRDRAFSDENIRKLVEKGAQVVILGNVQGSPQSQKMHRELRALQEEVNGKGPGRLIVATGWGVQEQRLLLAATDVQVNDSERGTEAAGFTETDVAVNGGIELAPPYLEGIYQQQGILLDRDIPGSGNTVIPKDESPESYSEAFSWLINLFDKERLKFASYQAVSVRLSRILDARLTAAEYLRQFDHALRRKEDPAGVLRRYLLGEKEIGKFLKGEWLRKDLIDALTHSSMAIPFEIKPPSEKIRGYAVNIEGVPFIVAVEKGTTELPQKVFTTFVGRETFESMLQPLRDYLTRIGTDKVQVVNAVTGERYGIYSTSTLLESGLPVGVPPQEGHQELLLVPYISDGEPSPLIDRASLFYSPELSPPVKREILSLIPEGIFQHLQELNPQKYQKEKLVWWTESGGFDPADKSPKSWSEEGFYLAVKKGEGQLILTLTPSLKGIQDWSSQLIKQKAFVHINLEMETDDLWIRYGRMNHFLKTAVQTSPPEDPEFFYFLTEHLRPFAEKLGFERIKIEQRLPPHRGLSNNALVQLGFKQIADRPRVWVLSLKETPAEPPPPSARAEPTSLETFQSSSPSEAFEERRRAEVWSQTIHPKRIPHLMVAINLMDIGAEVDSSGKVTYRDSLKKAAEILDILAESGVGEIYLYGGLFAMDAGGSSIQLDGKLFEKARAISEVLHQVPDTGRHFISSTRGKNKVTITVVNYATKKLRLGAVDLSDRFGNPFSVTSMMKLNPKLNPTLSEKDVKRDLEAFIQKAHQRGIKVGTGLITHSVSPDAIDETNYDQTFYREMPPDFMKAFRKLSSEDREKKVRELLEGDGSVFALRLDVDTEQERLIFIKHAPGMYAPNVDQAMLNPYHPTVRKYYYDSVKFLIDLNFDFVRVDLGQLLLKEKIEEIYRENWNIPLVDFNEEGEPWQKIIEDARRHKELKVQQAHAAGASPLFEKFEFIMEAYRDNGRDHRDTLFRLGADRVYNGEYEGIYKTHLRVAQGGEPAHYLLGSIRNAINAVIGSPDRLPQEFISTHDNTSQKAIGGAIQGTSISQLTSAHLGVPVMVDLRDWLGHQGHVIPLPGGLLDPLQEHAHPFVTEEEFKVRIDPEAFRQTLKNAPWTQLAQTFLRSVIGEKQKYIDYPRHSNRDRFMVLAWQSETDDWNLVVIDQKPRASIEGVLVEVELTEKMKQDIGMDYEIYDPSEKQVVPSSDPSRRIMTVSLAKGQEYRILNLRPVRRDKPVLPEASQRSSPHKSSEKRDRAEVRSQTSKTGRKQIREEITQYLGLINHLINSRKAWEFFRVVVPNDGNERTIGKAEEIKKALQDIYEIIQGRFYELVSQEVHWGKIKRSTAVLVPEFEKVREAARHFAMLLTALDELRTDSLKLRGGMQPKALSHGRGTQRHFTFSWEDVDYHLLVITRWEQAPGHQARFELQILKPFEQVRPHHLSTLKENTLTSLRIDYDESKGYPALDFPAAVRKLPNTHGWYYREIPSLKQSHPFKKTGLLFGAFIQQLDRKLWWNYAPKEEIPKTLKEEFLETLLKGLLDKQRDDLAQLIQFNYDDFPSYTVDKLRDLDSRFLSLAKEKREETLEEFIVDYLAEHIGAAEAPSQKHLIQPLVEILDQWLKTLPKDFFRPVPSNLPPHKAGNDLTRGFGQRRSEFGLERPKGVERAEVRKGVSPPPLHSTAEFEESFNKTSKRSELHQDPYVQGRIERFFGFLPPVSEFGRRFGLTIPEAEAAMADILLSWEETHQAGEEILNQQSAHSLSRLGLPAPVKVNRSKEKVAFIYLEGAAIDMGLLAAIPSTLASYGRDAQAGVVASREYQPFIERIRKEMSGQNLVAGEKLQKVLNQIASFRPGRIVILQGPNDAYLPAAAIKRLLPSSNIQVEVRTVTQADLDRAYASNPKIFERIQSLRREIEALQVSA